MDHKRPGVVFFFSYKVGLDPELECYILIPLDPLARVQKPYFTNFNSEELTKSRKIEVVAT